MAIYKGPLELSGSVDGVTYYKRKDMDVIIVRRKGGASAEKVKNAPEMEGTRRVNMEMGGRSAAVKAIRAGLWPLPALSDYGHTGELNKLLRPIQLMDAVSPLGQRSVCISKAPWLLEGFQLNKHRFENIIPNPLSLLFSESENTISVTFPALLPGINFFIPPDNYRWYSLVITCAVIPDFLYTPNGYHPAEGQQAFSFKGQFSDWLPVADTAGSLTLEIPYSPHSGKAVYVVAAGIRVARTADATGNISPVKYGSAAKVLAVRPCEL